MSAHKVIKVPVGGPAVLGTLDGSLDTLQEFVGGWIEALTIAPGVQVICNEEGKLKGLPPNRPVVFNGQVTDVLCGPFLITRIDHQGELDDIRHTEAMELLDQLNVKYEVPFTLGGKRS